MFNGQLLSADKKLRLRWDYAPACNAGEGTATMRRRDVIQQPSKDFSALTGTNNRDAQGAHTIRNDPLADCPPRPTGKDASSHRSVGFGLRVRAHD